MEATERLDNNRWGQRGEDEEESDRAEERGEDSEESQRERESSTWERRGGRDDRR